MFDWIGAALPWVIALALLLGVVAYVAFGARRGRRQSTGEEAQDLLSALRMMNAGGLDTEIIGLLDARLPNRPVRDDLKRAVTELLALKSGFDAAARGGMPQPLSAAHKQQTLKALDRMWQIAERESTAELREAGGKVDYGSVARREQALIEQLRAVRKGAAEARQALARATRGGWHAEEDAGDAAQINERMSMLSDAASALDESSE